MRQITATASNKTSICMGRERAVIGGIAGQYIEIARNTFLGADRENFYLRGTPTYLAEFHHNVSVGLRYGRSDQRMMATQTS